MLLHYSQTMNIAMLLHCCHRMKYLGHPVTLLSHDEYWHPVTYVVKL